MAVSITNNHKSFNHSKDLMIILKKNISVLELKYECQDDFTFIFSGNKLIGINVFNYEKYLDKVNSGYHSLSKSNQSKLIQLFANLVKPEDFDPFFKIGLVKTVEEHPKNPRLKILSVQVDDALLQIITNYEKIEANKNYLFAINGATTALNLEIVNSKVMGVESCGMLISYKQLGIDKEGVVDCQDLKIEDEFIF